MDDTILRGFCKKCEIPIAMINRQPIHGLPLENVPDEALEKTKDHNPIPVWFLSAKQMDIIDEWWEDNKQDYPQIVKDNSTRALLKSGHELSIIHHGSILEDNPFLVAKILKEAEEKI